jgi:uncharacterized protein (DUF1697 family)
MRGERSTCKRTSFPLIWTSGFFGGISAIDGMIRYVAFLRAINVGGRNLISMAHLVEIFAAAGLRNVRTYIQSGNVIFDSVSANSTAVRKKIEKKLRETLGYEVPVALRQLSELQEMVKTDPFKRARAEVDAMLFVVFLADEPAHKPSLPLISKTENLEVFEINNRTAFIIARRKKDGRCGYPNSFVEKELRVSGTTRNWNTVDKIVKIAAK